MKETPSHPKAIFGVSLENIESPFFAQHNIPISELIEIHLYPPRVTLLQESVVTTLVGHDTLAGHVT
ncbi:MAG: hypothetical protein MR215_04180, partial [Bacteroidales bacterium]|nr:hypothetical protein [Bacteroidales bacterium]